MGTMCVRGVYDAPSGASLSGARFEAVEGQPLSLSLSLSLFSLHDPDRDAEQRVRKSCARSRRVSFPSRAIAYVQTTTHLTSGPCRLSTILCATAMTIVVVIRRMPFLSLLCYD